MDWTILMKTVIARSSTPPKKTPWPSSGGQCDLHLDVISCNRMLKTSSISNNVTWRYNILQLIKAITTDCKYMWYLYIYIDLLMTLLFTNLFHITNFDLGFQFANLIFSCSLVLPLVPCRLPKSLVKRAVYSNKHYSMLGNDWLCKNMLLSM